jgi:hypothetical protein
MQDLSSPFHTNSSFYTPRGQSTPDRHQYVWNDADSDGLAGQPSGNSSSKFTFLVCFVYTVDAKVLVLKSVLLIFSNYEARFGGYYSQDVLRILNNHSSLERAVRRLLPSYCPDVDLCN